MYHCDECGAGTPTTHKATCSMARRPMSDPTPRTRLIRASSDLLDWFGTRTEDGRRLTAEWGEPVGHCPDSDEYIYEPMFTATEDGYNERAVASWLASPEAEEALARALGLAMWGFDFAAAHRDVMATGRQLAPEVLAALRGESDG